jgi:DNA-binding NarL/FixJ family response regulator
VSTEWIPVHPFASRIAIQQGERLMTRGMNVAGGVAGASGLDCCSLQIVDDHPLLRLGLRTLLSRDPNLRIVAECGDGACALNCMRKHRPDAVVLDITLPGGTDGLELIKQMLSEAPNTAILVLSVHDENLYASRVLSAGARGYLMKDAPPEHFLGAIRTVLAGEISVSPALAQRLVRRAVDGRMAPMDPSKSLSDRELEVLFRIGRGQSSMEIAAALHISVKTVETHRAKLRRKLALRTGAELMRYAVAWRHAEGRGISDGLVE